MKLSRYNISWKLERKIYVTVQYVYVCRLYVCSFYLSDFAFEEEPARFET